METWKKIKGFNYSVSDNGQIRNDKTGKTKSSVTNSHGYEQVDLYSENKRTTKTIHRLVAESFIDNPDNKPQINHKDGDKHNNAVDNLEWVSAKENMEHASKNGLTSHIPSYGMLGKKNPNGGVKGKPVMILETGETFASAAEAERITGVSDSSILDCIHGRTNSTRVGTFVYPE